MTRRPTPFFWKTAALLAGFSLFLCRAAPLRAEQANDLRLLTEISSPAAFYQDGVLSGMSVEIVREAQRELGSAEDIEILPWARAYQTALDRPGILIFSMARTPAREDSFLWIAEIFSVKLMLCGVEGRTFSIRSLEDAKRIPRIGVYRDDVRAQYLKDKGFANLDVAADSLTNVKKLLRGRVDLIAMSDLGLATAGRDMGVPVERIKPVFVIGETGMWLAASKGTDPAAVAAWRKAFERLGNKGVIDRIREQWMRPAR